MRVDCINQCLGDKINNNNANCLYPFPPRYILWRNDSAYSSYHDLKVCKENWNAFIELNQKHGAIRNNCESECRRDCVNRYYPQNKEIKDPRLYPDNISLNTTTIEFFHNNMPDQNIWHTAEMSLFNFVTNFLGLVGLWLGFSIWTALSDLKKFIRDRYLTYFNIPF